MTKATFRATNNNNVVDNEIRSAYISKDFINTFHNFNQLNYLEKEQTVSQNIFRNYTNNNNNRTFTNNTGRYNNSSDNNNNNTYGNKTYSIDNCNYFIYRDEQCKKIKKSVKFIRNACIFSAFFFMFFGLIAVFVTISGAFASVSSLKGIKIYYPNLTISAFYVIYGM
eukprot:Pgem_evm1s12059